MSNTIVGQTSVNTAKIANQLNSKPLDALQETKEQISQDPTQPVTNTVMISEEALALLAADNGDGVEPPKQQAYNGDGVEPPKQQAYNGDGVEPPKAKADNGDGVEPPIIK
ncbi:hypothetical protein [Shewanella sp. 1180_01]|uniref:hypothetical protein n=1 Tax=Shewanella sp. 1180_01 TaxID=2604451 RepID=UPI004063655C